MHFDKGRIFLDTYDMDIISKCPWSLNKIHKIKTRKDCLRCNVFSEIAKYVLLRSFRGTNLPSTRTLANKYDTILLEEGIDKDDRKFMARRDAGILADLLDLGSKFKNKVDIVNPEIRINLGRFCILDNIDAILFMDNKYYITKFVCDDHYGFEKEQICYQTIAGSYWLRENYDNVHTNGAYFIQLERTLPPSISLMDVTVKTEDLHSSLVAVTKELDELTTIKTEAEFNEHAPNILANLPKKFGIHCRTCMECFNL